MMTLEEIRKIEDPTDRAIFEAAYWRVQEPMSGIEGYEMFICFGVLLLFFTAVAYIAVKEYKRNNPHKFRKPESRAAV